MRIFRDNLEYTVFIQATPIHRKVKKILCFYLHISQRRRQEEIDQPAPLVKWIIVFVPPLEEYEVNETTNDVNIAHRHKTRWMRSSNEHK